MEEGYSTIETVKSVIGTKCPSCRKESLFAYPIYRMDKMLKMHKTCPSCQQDFVQEPGFYFGAMYFSYAFTIAIMVFFGVGYNVLFAPKEVLPILLFVFIPALIFSPFNYRLSRSLMLYVFGRIRKVDPKIYEQGV